MIVVTYSSDIIIIREVFVLTLILSLGPRDCTRASPSGGNLSGLGVQNSHPWEISWASESYFRIHPSSRELLLLSINLQSHAHLIFVIYFPPMSAKVTQTGLMFVMDCRPTNLHKICQQRLSNITSVLQYNVTNIDFSGRWHCEGGGRT